MGTGTGGTFAADAKQIGMSNSDIKTLIETLNLQGEKGTKLYQFKNKSYFVTYITEKGDTVLTSIKLKT